MRPRYSFVMQSPLLSLHKSITFWTRFGGLLFKPALAPDEGLYLFPCRAVHTVGMSYAIDVVFLDVDLNEIKRIDRLRPYRFVVCRKAQSVVELQAGYCQRNHDYLCRIRHALEAG